MYIHTNVFSENYFYDRCTEGFGVRVFEWGLLDLEIKLQDPKIPKNSRFGAFLNLCKFVHA